MYKKILVPLDGSDFAECSLAHAKSIAKGCQVSDVVVMQVVEPFHQVAEMGQDFIAEAEKQAQVSAKDYLAQVANSLNKEGLNVETVVRKGNPAEKILEYIKKGGVDLVIMSTHGRSGISRWVMGSVADRVIRHSTAPVLAISPPGCRI